MPEWTQDSECAVGESGEDSEVISHKRKYKKRVEIIDRKENLNNIME